MLRSFYVIVEFVYFVQMFVWLCEDVIWTFMAISYLLVSLSYLQNLSSNVHSSMEGSPHFQATLGIFTGFALFQGVPHVPGKV